MLTQLEWAEFAKFTIVKYATIKEAEWAQLTNVRQTAFDLVEGSNITMIRYHGQHIQRPSEERHNGEQIVKRSIGLIIRWQQERPNGAKLITNSNSNHGDDYREDYGDDYGDYDDLYRVIHGCFNK